MPLPAGAMEINHQGPGVRMMVAGAKAVGPGVTTNSHVNTEIAITQNVVCFTVKESLF